MMTPQNKQLAVVSAGTSDPSSTALLAQRASAQVVSRATEQNMHLTSSTIELRTLARDIADAMVTQFVSPALQDALDLVRDADALIVATRCTRPGRAAC